MTTSITKLQVHESRSSYKSSEYALETHASFFNNSNYSDIIIFFGTTGIKIPAHRIILAHKSPYIHNGLVKNPESGGLQLIQPAWSAHSFWRVFQYMYEKRYSLWPAEALRGIEDEPELLKHSTVGLIAQDLQMEDLETLALEHLRSQLHWSSSELIDCIQKMYATQNDYARRLFVTEAAKSYVQVPDLADALQKAAREVGEFAVDLMEALRNLCQQRED